MKLLDTVNHGYSKHVNTEVTLTAKGFLLRVALLHVVNFSLITNYAHNGAKLSVQ